MRGASMGVIPSTLVAHRVPSARARTESPSTPVGKRASAIACAKCWFEIFAAVLIARLPCPNPEATGRGRAGVLLEPIDGDPTHDRGEAFKGTWIVCRCRAHFRHRFRGPSP